MEVSSTTSSYVILGQLPSQPKKVVEGNTASPVAVKDHAEDVAHEHLSDVKNVQAPKKAEQDDPLKDPQSEESVQLEELKARDREVRTHEQAHLSAAGQYAKGGASFTYQRGPDGQQYAVGGEVQIDTSKVEGDPEATLQKAQTVQRAALAPAEPSGQDRAVASQAAMMAAEARQEIAAARGSDSPEGDSKLESTDIKSKATDNEEATAKLEKHIDATGANLLGSNTSDKQGMSIYA